MNESQQTAAQGILEKIGLRSGVYAIKNRVNGKLYVGSAADFKTRFSFHRWELRSGRHHSAKLQRAWNKYGEDAFEFAPLLVCSKKDLLFYEQRVLDGFDCVKSGYNILPRAGNHLGRECRPETRAKLSAAGRGRVMSEEMRAKCRARMLGSVWSEESKAKVRATMTGRKLSAETRAKLSARVISDETKAKIAATLRGHAVSAETIAKANATKAANRAARLAAKESV